MEEEYVIGRTTCLELAKKGEKLCRQGNFGDAIPLFLKALESGSEDLMTLSAIYCQLGNAYYSKNDMRNAYKYHCYDMMIAKLMRDDVGEAKACGNIGNVLKGQNLFSDALMFTNRQLTLAKNSENKDCIARALFNLGTIYHARAKVIIKNSIIHGKSSMKSDATTDANVTTGATNTLKSAPSYYEDLNSALTYYCKSLRESTKSVDLIASGRVYGCIGNVLHLLGNYQGAVECHSERLSIACQFGDYNAKHRAYINLGNAHVLLSQISEAIGYYQCALNLAVEKCDKSREAQCSFYLANASSLKKDYSSAAMYHIRHLSLARELNDLAGMARAYMSLATVYTNMNEYSKAAYFLVCSQALAKEMCDDNMVTAAVESLKRLVEENNDVLDMEGGCVRLDSSDDPEPQFHFCRVDTSQSTVVTVVDQPSSGLTAYKVKPPFELTSEESEGSKNAFLDLLSRLQSSRLDEQRCDISVLNSKTIVGRRQTDSSVITPNESTEALIDLLMNAQGRRMNEQRAALLPGLKNKEQTQELIEKLGSSDHSSDSRIDETLIDLLMSAQEQRMNDQRSDLVRDNENPIYSDSSTLTTPEEDLLAVVMRMQAGRLEEQRAHFKK
ncbi:tetratricopeptide repeat protein [Dictyocaulus viviparus]|uniref:Tetratricopeptide repeat protein n=1 Tax=Dictyocaulus viviparus TaxID=29172 RepID=A0A0D8Y206_DICVI|nr:tetratricopeptide repeat protein [Dictyocaulus viviparus]